MWASTGVCVLGFSNMDFSTGSSVSNDAAIAVAQNHAMVGASVGCVVGIVISLLPGERGKDLGIVSAVAVPIGTLIGSVVFAVAVSFILFLLAIFDINGLQYQRSIIVTGMWAIPAIVTLSTALGKKEGRSGSRGYSGGWSYTGSFSGTGASGGRLFDATCTGGFGTASAFHTTRDLLGDGTTTRGSDGTTFHTTRNLFSDGWTTRGSDGTTYSTTRDLFGDGTTTRGSDGSVYRTTKDLFGDGTTTRRE
jgi:hypothetical protein